jgi:hypothetical protein
MQMQLSLTNYSLREQVMTGGLGVGVGGTYLGTQVLSDEISYPSIQKQEREERS